MKAPAPSPESPAGQTLTELIGNTPLLRLERLCPRGNLFAKAEWTNPGGSVKDRAVWGIMREAIRDGRLTRDKTILDATSGNTGIAYAMLGAALGYRVLLCMPAGVTPERQKILRAYGAEVVLTDPQLFSDGAILKARELHAAAPERYFYGDQYSNDANWRSHEQTTGPEIFAQTAGRVTHFVAGLGTSGSFVGTTRHLKARHLGVRCVALEPDGPLHGLEGMKHMASALVPRIWNPAVADARLAISTEEAYAMTRRLAREEGLFVGPSSGANVAGALEVAASLPAGRRAVIVTLLPDGGGRYLSERFWEAAP